jgi:hypothetical protein
MKNTKALEVVRKVIELHWPNKPGWRVTKEMIDEAAPIIQAAIDEATATLKSQLAAEQAMCDRLAGALWNVARHDVSVAGDRGKGPFKHGGEHPKLGINPNVGGRWATPAEIAQDALTTYTAHKEGR